MPLLEGTDLVAVVAIMTLLSVSAVAGIVIAITSSRRQKIREQKRENHIRSLFDQTYID